MLAKAGMTWRHTSTNVVKAAWTFKHLVKKKPKQQGQNEQISPIRMYFFMVSPF